MSTSNFGYDKLLGIIAVNTLDNEYDSFDWEFIFDDVKEFNKELSDLKLVLNEGYYESAWYSIESRNSYLDMYEAVEIIKNRNNKTALTKVCKDIDANYYGISPKKIIEDYKKIIDWINTGIKNKFLLNCSVAYAFSNGETGYNTSFNLLEV